MRSSPDPTSAAWLAERLSPDVTRVGGVVPTGFARYVRVLHPADAHDPLRGSLPPTVARELCAVLARHTQHADHCVFCVWHGHGDLRIPANASLVELPHRRMYVLRGALHDALESLSTRPMRHQSANLWWPADHTWCVATDVDLRWTYVGGTEACINDVLAHPSIEAAPADINDLNWPSLPQHGQ